MTHAINETNYSFTFNCLVALTTASVTFTVIAAIAALETPAIMGIVISALLFSSLLASMGETTYSYYPPTPTCRSNLFNDWDCHTYVHGHAHTHAHAHTHNHPHQGM
jgi:hypothetical protein